MSYNLLVCNKMSVKKFTDIGMYTLYFYRRIVHQKGFFIEYPDSRVYTCTRIDNGDKGNFVRSFVFDQCLR